MVSFNEDARMVSDIFKAAMVVVVIAVFSIASNEGKKINNENTNMVNVGVVEVKSHV